MELKRRVGAGRLSAAAVATLLAAGAAIADPAEVGRWSGPINLHVIGTHSTLLHSGAVLLFSYPAPGEHGSDTWTFDPATQTSRQVPTVLRRDVFCAGHSVLPDGRVFVTGGTMWGTHAFIGAHQTSLFDPVTARWSRGPDMAFARWYPTNLTLADGDVLIVAGTDTFEHDVPVMERLGIGDGSIVQLPSSADTSTIEYPRMLLLRDGRVLLAGQLRATLLFDPATEQWTPVDEMIFGDRFAGSTVLLPDMRQVLALGGNTIDPEAPHLGTNPPTDSAEILDLAEPVPRWRSIAPMNQARQHANAVLLPDGTVLVVGGGQSGLYGRPVHSTELFDPRTETWAELAAEVTPRAYHSAAVLLPDGRVFSSGMDHGRWRSTGEIYSPPYLFHGPRPSIAAAPSGMGYGGSFTVETPEAATISSAVLMRPGSATHAVNFDQRYVGLELHLGAASGELTLGAPPSGAVAPPGWYMLFLVDAAGVPSTAVWIQVG